MSVASGRRTVEQSIQAAAERVSDFLDARAKGTVNDPELIYGVNGHDLTVSDLRALILWARSK